jgi:hypothetical protein
MRAGNLHYSVRLSCKLQFARLVQALGIPAHQAWYASGSITLDDCEAQIRRIPTLFPKKESADRQTPQSRDVPNPGGGKKTRTRRPVFQKARLISTTGDNMKSATKRKPPVRTWKKPGKSTRWSAAVTQTSDVLSLEPNVFKRTDPRRIASSLKHSAETSRKRKGGPFQSAMSMLNFYINRAGRGLPPRQKAILNRAKDELRKAFGKQTRDQPGPA